MRSKPIFTNKTYGYDVKDFLVHTLSPCVISATIIVATLMLFVKLVPESLGRFFLTFGIAEVMIIAFGYFIVLDNVERERLKNYVLRLGRI